MQYTDHDDLDISNPITLYPGFETQVMRASIHPLMLWICVSHNNKLMFYYKHLFM